MGHFNVTTKDTDMKAFLSDFSLESLIQLPTCFKSSTNPSCTDLILTNYKNSFMHSKTLETRISNYHILVIAVTKKKFNRGKPNIINFRCYKHFDENKFNQELIFSTSNFQQIR